MIFDHMVKVGKRVYLAGEDVPMGMDETSVPTKTEQTEKVEETKPTPKRRGRKKG